MPMLIDGHNLIGALPELSLQDPDDEQKLVDLLHRWCVRARKSVRVVFDPGPPGGCSPRSTSRVKVEFARGEADNAIVRVLEGIRDRANYTVITSDSELAGRVRRAGGRVVSSQAFARQLHAAPAPPHCTADPQPAPEEVEELLALFRQRRPGKPG